MRLWTIPTEKTASQKVAARCCLWFARRMERLAQILDDLDDLYFMVGLTGEKIRNVSMALLFSVLAAVLMSGGILLALAHPPIALATAIILFVSLLYHTVTSPRLEIA